MTAPSLTDEEWLAGVDRLGRDDYPPEERANGRARPAIVGLRAFLAVPDDPLTYRIEKVWPIGARVILAAQFKAGKSTLGANLLRSLVDGEPLLGTFDVTPFAGTLVLIDDELDDRTLRRWLREQGIADVDRVAVLPLRGRVATFDLLNPEHRAGWAADLRAVGASIVVLDCLRCCWTRTACPSTPKLGAGSLRSTRC
jgi:hypothetical protein